MCTRQMTDISYNPKSIGLLLVDPYNDFLAPEGKLWPRLKDTAESEGASL